MNSELSKEQKIDRVRQALYLAVEKNNGICRLYNDVDIVYFESKLFVCDLTNHAETIFDSCVFFDFNYGFKSEYGDNDIITTILECTEI